jgi:hypothetical protein
MTKKFGYESEKIADSFVITPEIAATLHPRCRTLLVNGIHVWDGQTIMLSAFTPAVGANTPRYLLIFITPALIDPAGNALHSDAETPAAK